MGDAEVFPEGCEATGSGRCKPDMRPADRLQKARFRSIGLFLFLIPDGFFSFSLSFFEPSTIFLF